MNSKPVQGSPGKTEIVAEPLTTPEVKFTRSIRLGMKVITVSVDSEEVEEWSERFEREPHTSLEKLCKAELDRWTAETKKLEPLTDFEVEVAYESEIDRWSGFPDWCMDDQRHKRALRAVVTAHDERKAEIAREMVEEDLVSKLDQMRCGATGAELVAAVREYDAQKRVVFEAECITDPDDSLEIKRLDSGNLCVRFENKCDGPISFHLTSEKATELAHALDPENCKRTELLKARILELEHFEGADHVLGELYAAIGSQEDDEIGDDDVFVEKAKELYAELERVYDAELDRWSGTSCIVAERHKRALRAAVTAHDERKAEIAREMVEEDLVNSLAIVIENGARAPKAWVAVARDVSAMVRGYDAQKRVFEAECAIEGGGYGIKVHHDTCDGAPGIEFYVRDKLTHYTVLTPEKAAELAHALNPPRPIETAVKHPGQYVLAWREGQWTLTTVCYTNGNPGYFSHWLPLPPDVKGGDNG